MSKNRLHKWKEKNSTASSYKSLLSEENSVKETPTQGEKRFTNYIADKELLNNQNMQRNSITRKQITSFYNVQGHEQTFEKK